MGRILLQLFYGFFFVGCSFGQTLIMNEVSQGTTGNMEYVEFVVVDTTVTYDCLSGTPPTIDIRGWIYDDNSGYHGTAGVAAGCIRFAFHPTWQAVPLGTIILIYNDAAPDPSIPPADLTLSDGDCRIVAPISDVNLFESNATTPGAVACSYPAIGWTPGGNWNNLLLANPGDCARIVDLSGCEVFSVCYGVANANTLIYFQNGAELPNDHRNSVYYFNDGDANVQSNWSIGCSDNEVVLDANLCGSNMQTPGAPNNAANAAFIAQFNNGCTPIPPVAGTALVDNHEQCGCDGQATATGSGSIGPYTFEWFDASMAPIGQTNATATSLCPGTYFVTITSSIDCNITQSITINPGPGTPSFTLASTDPTACGVSDGTITISGLNASATYDVTYDDNGLTTGPQALISNGSGNIVISGLSAGAYDNFTVSLNGCIGTNATSVILVEPIGPSINDLPDQTVCDIYTLPAITGTALTGSEGYFSAPNGVGPIAAGSSITTTQTIYLYDINGTCSEEQSVLITINNTPSIDPINDTSACGSLTLPAITGSNLTSGAAFYDNSQALGGGLITGPVTSSQTVWIYDEEGTCNDETSFVVTINQLPDAGIGGGGVYCNPPLNFNPVTIGIMNFGTPPYSLTYAVNGTPSTVTPSTQSIYLGGADGVNTYTLISISDQYCTTMLSGSVTVEITNNYNTPVVIQGDSTYCLGDPTAMMSVEPYGTAAWYLSTGDSLGAGSSIMPLQVLGTTTYYVRQFINDCGGLPAWVTITMEPCDMIVPTAFTPNSDGVHDVWEIINLDVVNPKNVVTIYNRWGNQIYQSEEGNYEGHPWDGTYNGKALPVGSYYFIIDLNEEEKENLSGIVSIVLDK